MHRLLSDENFEISGRPVEVIKANEKATRNLMKVSFIGNVANQLSQD